jgi:transcription termination/antitermination protein NusG
VNEPLENLTDESPDAGSSAIAVAEPGDIAHADAHAHADSPEHAEPANHAVMTPMTAGTATETAVSADAAAPAAAEPAPKKKYDLPPNIAAPAQPGKKYWYVVKVTSGREDTIARAVERKVKKDNLEEFFGRVLVPTEKYTEVRNGKRITKSRKKFPGYIMCEVEFNKQILLLFRETSGVGDFVGGSLHRDPTPMSPLEVQRMIGDTLDEKAAEEAGIKTATKIKIPYGINDRVKVRDGTFAGMEGEVKEITEPRDAKENPKVKVVLSIWGRPVDVEVEYWQVDPV